MEDWWAHSLILPNWFSFRCFLSHYKTHKITHCGYYFMLLFFLFPNLENTNLSSRSLPRLMPKSLEFISSPAVDPAALRLSQPAVLTAGYFVLSNENSCNSSPLFLERLSASDSSDSCYWTPSDSCSVGVTTHCLARAPVPWVPFCIRAISTPYLHGYTYFCHCSRWWLQWFLCFS